MPDSSATQDIPYQPKTTGSSYVAPKQISDNPKKSNIFFTLGLEVFGLLFLFLVFLGLLNYFNVISLNRVSPTLLSWLPTQNFEPKNQPEPQNSEENQWTLNGKLEKYDDKSIRVKYGSKSLTLEYNYKTNFYSSESTLDFPSNVLVKQNTGRKIFMRYRVEKDKNILETITFQ